MPRACRTIPGALVRRSTAGRRSCLVGEQLDARGSRRHAGHEADEAVGGDDRVVDANAVARARRNDDRLRERPGRPADDLGGDRLEVAREPGTVAVGQQAPEIVVLLERELALDRALAQLLDVLGGSRSASERASRRLSAQL